MRDLVKCAARIFDEEYVAAAKPGLFGISGGDQSPPVGHPLNRVDVICGVLDHPAGFAGCRIAQIDADDAVLYRGYDGGDLFPIGRPGYDPGSWIEGATIQDMLIGAVRVGDEQLKLPDFGIVFAQVRAWLSVRRKCDRAVDIMSDLLQS